MGCTCEPLRSYKKTTADDSTEARAQKASMSTFNGDEALILKTMFLGPHTILSSIATCDSTDLGTPPERCAPEGRASAQQLGEDTGVAPECVSRPPVHPSSLTTRSRSTPMTSAPLVDLHAL